MMYRLFSSKIAQNICSSSAVCLYSFAVQLMPKTMELCFAILVSFYFGGMSGLILSLLTLNYVALNTCHVNKISSMYVDNVWFDYLFVTM